MAGKLDSRHHAFLQAIMTRGPLHEKTAMAMFKRLFRSSSGDGFIPFLGAINKELEFVQMEVKKVMNQYDGKEFYGIINTLPSKEAKLGTKFSQAQILFFTAVMEAIVQDPSASGLISSTDALNLRLEPQGDSQSQAASSPAAPVKMSMQAKDEALSLLKDEQFLSRAPDGRVGLGVKAFLELRSVFRNLEVPFCEVCNEAAIKAQLCSGEECAVRIHSYCLSRKFQSRNQTPKCLACQTPWKRPVEDEETDDEPEEDIIIPIATQEPEPAQNTGKRSRPRSKRKLAVIEDEDEETELGDKENSNPTLSFSLQTRTRSLK